MPKRINCLHFNPDRVFFERLQISFCDILFEEASHRSSEEASHRSSEEASHRSSEMLQVQSQCRTLKPSHSATSNLWYQGSLREHLFLVYLFKHSESPLSVTYPGFHKVPSSPLYLLAFFVRQWKGSEDERHQRSLVFKNGYSATREVPPWWMVN